MLVTDPELDGYLDDALAAPRMAAIEAALRDDPQLVARLAAALGRRDAGLHSLAGIWRKHRLSCPTRQQLGSRLLGVLDPAADDYVTFHLEVVGCRRCASSLEDLRQQHAADEATVARRRSRYFQSSAGYLSADS